MQMTWQQYGALHPSLKSKSTWKGASQEQMTRCALQLRPAAATAGHDCRRCVCRLPLLPQPPPQQQQARRPTSRAQQTPGVPTVHCRPAT
jgi:hypothetical protein